MEEEEETPGTPLARALNFNEDGGTPVVPNTVRWEGALVQLVDEQYLLARKAVQAKSGIGRAVP